MPNELTTDNIDLGAFFWQHGLEFCRVAADSHHAHYVFLDPDGRAEELARQFRRQSSLREFLHCRRRLGFSLRVARASAAGVATLHELDHPNPRLRPLLVAAALKQTTAAR